MANRHFTRVRFLMAIAVLVAVVLAIIGCGSSGSSSGGTSTSEAQSAAQGDIPDNQKFLTYDNKAAGYSIKYPEGWAQKGSGNHVTFSDKGNSVDIVIAPGSAPTAASVAAQLKKEAAKDPTIKPGTPQQVTVGPNQAIHVVYHALGAPDPVTGKKLPLMVDRYVLAKNGKVATVDEVTPVGVDNVDAYKLIIESFRWA